MAKKELSPFEVAFAAARKAGEKEFEFKGKKYHTRTKEEDDKAKAAPKSEPASAPKSDSVDLTKQSVARDTGGASAKLLSAAGTRKKESTPTRQTTSENTTRRRRTTGMRGGELPGVEYDYIDSRAPSASRKLVEDIQRKKQSELDKYKEERKRKSQESRRSMPNYAKGGSVSKRADGCVIRGKTRGKVI